jgi:transposase
MTDYEIITDGGRRRRWPSAKKLRIVEETLEDGARISVVARRNGVAPNLRYRWCRLMLDGGVVAVSEEDDVTSNRAVRQMEERIRELERQLGRKPLEVEILKEALGRSYSKKSDLACAVAAEGLHPMTIVATVLGVSRSNLHARLTVRVKLRRRYQKTQDAVVLPLIFALVTGARHLWLSAHHGVAEPAVAPEGAALINHKRVYLIMQAHNLLLAQRYIERPE